MVVKANAGVVGREEKKQEGREGAVVLRESERERESESCWSKAGGGQQRQIGLAAWAVRQPRQAECVSRGYHVGAQARLFWV